MMGLISCYSEVAVQVSEKTSCANYKTVSNSVSTNLIPSIQTSVTNLYKTCLSTGVNLMITVTWCRNGPTQGLQIMFGDDVTTSFRLNTNSRLFRKKRGNKTLEINGVKFDVFYDLSTAGYDVGPEPVDGYYVLIMVGYEVCLCLGDMSAVKKVKSFKEIGNFYLVTRREYFYGNTLYSTRVQFSDSGSLHDVMIQCNGVKTPVLSVWVDKRVVIRVKRLQWNFRGNQTIFVDGFSIDLMWDVHDWFFYSGSENGSGHAVFLFKTRNGLDSRLWLEEKVKTKEENKEFSLLIYATKS